MNDVWTIIIDFLPDVERFKLGILNKNIYRYTRKDIKYDMIEIYSKTKIPNKLLTKFSNQINWRSYLDINDRLNFEMFRIYFNDIYDQITKELINDDYEIEEKFYLILDWTTLLINSKYDIAYLKKIKDDKKINADKVETLIDLIKNNHYLKH